MASWKQKVSITSGCESLSRSVLSYATIEQEIACGYSLHSTTHEHFDVGNDPGYLVACGLGFTTEKDKDKDCVRNSRESREENAFIPRT